MNDDTTRHHDESYEKVFGYHYVKKNERMGKSKHGGYSSNTFDHNGSLTGESPFHPVEDAEDYHRRVDSDPNANRQTDSGAFVQEVIATVIVILAKEAAAYAAPRMERWVKTRLVPAIKHYFANLKRRFAELEPEVQGELAPFTPVLSLDPASPHTKDEWVMLMAKLSELQLVPPALVTEVDQSSAFKNSDEVSWVELFQTFSKPNQRLFQNLGESAEGYLQMQRQLEA